MTMSVIDASALTDAFIGGEDSRLLRAFSATASPLDLIAPDLIFPETANALRKATIRGGADPDEVGRYIERLQDLSLISVGMQRLLPHAWRSRGSMTIQDAMYAALAQESSLPLITSDRRLAEAALAADVLVLLTGSDPLDVFLSAFGV